MTIDLLAKIILWIAGGIFTILLLALIWAGVSEVFMTLYNGPWQFTALAVFGVLVAWAMMYKGG